MANDTLQAESVTATPAFPAHEEAEFAVMLYASGAVRAAMDALAALDAINFGQLFDRCSHHEGDRERNEAGQTLLRLSRRRLREAVGTADHPGYDPFLDMIAAHGLDIYDD